MSALEREELLVGPAWDEEEVPVYEYGFDVGYAPNALVGLLRGASSDFLG